MFSKIWFRGKVGRPGKRLASDGGRRPVQVIRTAAPRAGEGPPAVASVDATFSGGLADPAAEARLFHSLSPPSDGGRPLVTRPPETGSRPGFRPSRRGSPDPPAPNQCRRAAASLKGASPGRTFAPAPPDAVAPHAAAAQAQAPNDLCHRSARFSPHHSTRAAPGRSGPIKVSAAAGRAGAGGGAGGPAVVACQT